MASASESFEVSLATGSDVPSFGPAAFSDVLSCGFAFAFTAVAGFFVVVLTCQDNIKYDDEFDDDDDDNDVDGK